jgi:prepilin-type processing-associated H-X9-DG protein
MRNVVSMLVVVLLVGLCGGLLVTGVARIQDAAARTQCTNNLKQIAFAVHTYNDVYLALPSAEMPNPALPRERRLSWLVSVEPFLGVNRNKMDREKSWDAEENRFAALSCMPTYQCPAYPERPLVSTLVPSHYLGISGIGIDAISLPRDDPQAGLFGYGGKIRFSAIPSGRESVLLAVETSQASGAWTAAGPATVRGLDPGGPPYLAVNGQFGGNHPGGANTAFLDASVRFLNDSLDPRVFESFAILRGHGDGKPLGNE